MKTTRGLTVIGSALLLAGATQSRAQSADKLYLDMNVGPAVPQSTEIRSSPFGTSGNIQYDIGVRGGINLGYNFTDSFAGELETGVIWNNIHSVHGNDLLAANATADLYQVPLLANFIYKPFHQDFDPYIGIGVGGAMTYFDSSNVPLFGGRFTDADFTLAYQVEVGFKYSISPKAELGLEYKFLGTTDHSWEDRGITLKTEGTMTHAILATFDWRF